MAKLPKLTSLAPARIARLREWLNLNPPVFAPVRRLLEIATRHPEVLVAMV
jgi:hypothetical protein